MNFTKMLESIDYGDLNKDLDQEMQTLLRAVEVTHKGGTLTLQFKMKPGKGDSGQIEITPVIKTVLPEFERGAAIMFITPEGHLTNQDPRQKNLTLQKLEPKEHLKFANAEGN